MTAPLFATGVPPVGPTLGQRCRCRSTFRRLRARDDQTSLGDCKDKGHHAGGRQPRVIPVLQVVAVRLATEDAVGALGQREPPAVRVQQLAEALGIDDRTEGGTARMIHYGGREAQRKSYTALADSGWRSAPVPDAKSQCVLGLWTSRSACHESVGMAARQSPRLGASASPWLCDV